jgi:two-component system, chemotaxis family, chemotaxis protein CheY
MKILIAEDDLVSRKFLLKFFSLYGRCDLVVDGLEAVDAFLLSVQEKDPYDLVCLDIMMPKVNGAKVLKAIRDLETQQGMLPENRSKVIIITALAETQFVQNAFEFGCEAYVMKPVDTKKLTEELKNMNLI